MFKHGFFQKTNFYRISLTFGGLLKVGTQNKKLNFVVETGKFPLIHRASNQHIDISFRARHEAECLTKL